MRIGGSISIQRTGFTPAGDIEVEGGIVVGKNYSHLAHGYVVTSHAAQGKTVDRVVVVQGAESFPASSREQFYVSATRGRESLTVFTDDREGLKRAIQRSDPRPSATELVQPSATHPAWVAWLTRRAKSIQRLAAAALGSASPVSPPERHREVSR